MKSSMYNIHHRINREPIEKSPAAKATGQAELNNTTEALFGSDEFRIGFHATFRNIHAFKFFLFGDSDTHDGFKS